MASDIPVDVYYVGDFPASAKAKVEVAIEEHEWNIEGLLATSEVVVTENSGSETNGGPGAGGFAGIAVAALAAAGIGFFVYKKTQSDVPVAKAELETDEESSDDEKKIPEIKVEAVKGK